MKRFKYIRTLMLASAMLVLTRCNLFDPTQGVENPNLTYEAMLGTPGSGARWINGLERQQTIVYNGLVTILEIGSDNYDNTNTFYNQSFDGLIFDFKDTDINTLQFRIADLRQSAVIGLAEVLPADATSTAQHRAEAYFFKGWAELLAGEIFVALPKEPEGTPASPTENFDAAIADFTEAENIDGNNVSYKLALARAYYAKGDKVNAAAKATQAITLDAGNNFTRVVLYDGVNTVTNTMQDALYDRGTFDDLQPLPRLDFLDPKYYARSGTIESNVYIQKVEEAHLILAEVHLSNNDLPAAQASLNNAIAIVNARPNDTFNDSAEGRTQSANGSRPNKTTVDVRASESDPYVSNLVLSRAGSVTVPVVSGTSVTTARVNALATTDEALELLYLMRQEVFIAEGRRFVDLGLRLPISEVEKLQNTKVSDEQIVGFKPSFIPADMDAITYDAAANTATIKHNLNRVLVQNKTSPLVMPFH